MRLFLLSSCTCRKLLGAAGFLFYVILMVCQKQEAFNLNLLEHNQKKGQFKGSELCSSECPMLGYREEVT